MAHEWVPAFLAALASVPNVSAACRAAGIERSTAYRHKADDKEFASAWEDALDQSVDDLVGESYRRARDGVSKPVYYKGRECGRVQEYSDTLAIFLLKSHRPAVYRESVKQEHSGDLTIRVEYADADVDPEAAEAPPGTAEDPQGSEAV